MIEPIIGSIFLWPVSWAPYGYYFCEGQLLNIQNYAALYSLIGTMYGGDGKTNFALPDLRGCVPIGAGQAPGFSYYQLASDGGVPTETLTLNQMAAHYHDMSGIAAPISNTPQVTVPNLTSAVTTAQLAINTTSANSDIPGTNAVPAPAPSVSMGSNFIYGAPNGSANIPVDASLAPGQTFRFGSTGGSVSGTLANTGGGMSHNNMQPYLCVNYLIAWDGIYPDFS